jgi:protein gp37
MSDTTKIEWADATFNPWEGCTKVSAGCANCYAEARNKRFSGGANWGKGKPRRRTSEATWRKPVAWNAKPFVCDFCGASHGLNPDGEAMCHECDAENPSSHRQRVFPSLCDIWDDEVPIEWLADYLSLVHDTPNLDHLILTKRPELALDRLHEAMCPRHRGYGQDEIVMWPADWWEGDKAPPHAWLGVSVENQAMAELRIPQLLAIPAAVRFLSVERMLEAIDLQSAAFNGADSIKSLEGIHWVIFGGESGPGARPCNVDWIREGIKQCRQAGVPVFVKQVGANVRGPEHEMPGDWPSAKFGNFGTGETRAIKLKDPKGGDMAEWPEDLRVREFPATDGHGQPLTAGSGVPALPRSEL